MVKWNWGRKTDSSKKKPAPITQNSNTSLISLLNDWKTENSTLVKSNQVQVTNQTNSSDTKPPQCPSPIASPLKSQPGYDLENLNEPSSISFPPPAVLSKNEDLDSVIDMSQLDTAENIISRPFSRNPYSSYFQNNLPNNSKTRMTLLHQNPTELSNPVQERQSANTQKYHQIISYLNEYADELQSIMEELKSEAPFINQTSATNSDNESIISSSSGTTVNSTMTLTIENSTAGTPTSDIYDVPKNSTSSLSLTEDKPIGKREMHKYTPIENPKKLHIEVYDTKQELITDLGIPRTKRGSVLLDALDLDEHNDYNALIAKQYFSARKPTSCKGKHMRSKCPESPNIFSPTKTFFNRLMLLTNLDNYEEGEETKKTGEYKNSPLRKTFAMSKDEHDNIKIKTEYKPNYEFGNKNISLGRSGSKTSGLTIDTAHSSIKTTITSLDSPPDIFIYKNTEVKDRLKQNRASSVYVTEPVHKFKNIDLQENPLPQIGNLLSNNMSDTFNIPSNPYATSETSSFTTSNPHFDYKTHNPYASDNPYL